MWARALPACLEGDNPAVAESTLVSSPKAHGELGGHYTSHGDTQFPHGEVASWFFSGMTFVEASQTEALW